MLRTAVLGRAILGYMDLGSEALVIPQQFSNITFTVTA